MANELNVTSSISFSKSGAGISNWSSSKAITVTGNNYVKQTQQIPTSEEAIDIGDIGSTGYIKIKNLDSTNFVEVGLTASYPIKLLAGQFCLFPPGSGALYAKADTASVRIETAIVEL